MRGIVGRPVVGHLGPGADPHAVGLRDAAVLQEGAGRRLLVRPDALLEGAAQLGMVRLAHEVVPLVVEGGVEEELLVLELEVLVLLADAALAQRDELLALGQRAHRNGPFLEGNRHVGEKGSGKGFVGGFGVSEPACACWRRTPTETTQDTKRRPVCQVCERSCEGEIRLYGRRSVAAAAGGLDPQPVAGRELAGGLRGDLGAVQQVSARARRRRRPPARAARGGGAR